MLMVQHNYTALMSVFQSGGFCSFTHSHIQIQTDIASYFKWEAVKLFCRIYNKLLYISEITLQ